MFRLPLIAIASFLIATAALAHPGHGEAGQAFALGHYLTEPLHLFGAAVVALALLGGVRALRRRSAGKIRRAHS